MRNYTFSSVRSIGVVGKVPKSEVNRLILRGFIFPTYSAAIQKELSS